MAQVTVTALVRGPSPAPAGPRGSVDGMPSRRAQVRVALVACGGLAVGACGAARGAAPRALALRPACGDGHLWDGAACRSTAEADRHLAAGRAALADSQVEAALAELDAAAQAGPLPHAANVALWEQRGIAAAYLEDEAGARRAFAAMLALEPGHLLSYTLSPKVTFAFEKVRTSADLAVPSLEVTWSRGQRVGDPVRIDVEAVADPARLLHAATLFVRRRGERAWQLADVALAPGERRAVVLPAVPGARPASLELYLRARDAAGNEVLTWADPAHPREVPLRYEPPTPWYRTWWGVTLVGGAVALGTGAGVYALTLAPPDRVGGTVTVR